MSKALLTSTGFDNPNLTEAFLSAIRKDPSNIRVLFIPTAAFGEGKESIKMIPNFMRDLTYACKIPKENITTYNLDGPFTDNILQYDCIYFTGGDEKYLVKKIFAQNFNNVLNHAIKHDVFIIGVSAGAVIFSNYKYNIGIPLIPNSLDVHFKKSNTPDGEVPPPNTPIKLSDNQGLLILNKYKRIIS